VLSIFIKLLEKQITDVNQQSCVVLVSTLHNIRVDYIEMEITDVLYSALIYMTR